MNAETLAVPNQAGLTFMGRLALPMLGAGVFLAAYLSIRPFDILFTVSDFFFCLGGILLISARLVPMRPFGSMTPFWLLGFASMQAGLLLGSIINGDTDRWLIVAIQYGFSFMFLPMLLVGQPRSRTLYMVRALVLGVCVMELIGAILYYGYDGSYEDFKAIGHDFVSGNQRLGAFATDANWNAALIAMTVPFVLYLRTKNLIGWITAIIAAATLGLGLILSASFTGFSSCLMALFIFITLGRVRPSFKMMLAIPAAAALYFASGYGLPSAFEARVAPALETGDMNRAGTYTGRMELIQEAWKMVDDTMFVGLGVDQYRKHSDQSAPVHNIYLLLWTEGGIFSLIGWLIMLMVFAIAIIQSYRHDRLAAALGLSVLFTFLVFSTAAPHMYARLWVVPLLLAMGVVFEVLSSSETGAFEDLPEIALPEFGPK